MDQASGFCDTNSFECIETHFEKQRESISDVSTSSAPPEVKWDADSINAIIDELKENRNEELERARTELLRIFNEDTRFTERLACLWDSFRKVEDSLQEAKNALVDVLETALKDLCPFTNREDDTS